jgi:hypothetical protein
MTQPIEPVPEYLSAIECVELAESMHRYSTDMDSLAKTDRMMAGVLALLGKPGRGQGAALVDEESPWTFSSEPGEERR